ncbi:MULTISPECIES: HAMP domain-containing sensor histidine kinase [unclassified Duganella]|uniref:sensor histidine kinase n=1 Tax=unclassified Duganella TaxID=2636909 RepID=UPI000E34A63B|nr:MULTISPECIES: ATP-binding protein [unclassified Duganella]RFP14692.1 sensor histidine kinase [Duganella sp. BJB475]RFP31040.1 sensor histidine kinase [Duganella sp. BJB476]
MSWLRYWLQRLWRVVAEPTLVRRLMLVQVVLVLVMWGGVIAIIVHNGGDSSGYLKSTRNFDAVISVADNLASQPERQRQSLSIIDSALRDDFEASDLGELGPIMLVWQGGRLVYRSKGAPPDLRGSGTEDMETLYIQDKRYRARTVRSSTSDTQVMMAGPVGVLNVFVTINSRGYFLLPLLISLPLLPLPAWWSIRIAMRPWRRVAQEVAARGPQDLTPLSFKPPHRELAAMVDSVNALLLRVNQSALRERSFIADAAHELRTPLAAMRVNAEAMQGQANGPVQRELLNGILSSGNRAGRLVGQLLQLMRSDATGSEPHARLALDALLQDRLAALSGLASRGGVELELAAAEPVCVMGQRESLVSLVDNLVENAIKYSPPHGVVRVSLACVAGQAVLTVEDQGPGIAPELRTRVFDRFFRDPHQTKSGSGLGLAIAASVAASHGGTIELSDAQGGGLLAQVQLPLCGGQV